MTSTLGLLVLSFVIITWSLYSSLLLVSFLWKSAFFVSIMCTNSALEFCAQISVSFSHLRYIEDHSLWTPDSHVSACCLCSTLVSDVDREFLSHCSPFVAGGLDIVPLTPRLVVFFAAVIDAMLSTIYLANTQYMRFISDIIHLMDKLARDCYEIWKIVKRIRYSEVYYSNNTPSFTVN